MSKSGFERPSPIHKQGDLPPSRAQQFGKPIHALHASGTADNSIYRASSGMPVKRPKPS